MNISAVGASTNLWAYRASGPTQDKLTNPVRLEQNTVQRDTLPDLSAPQKVNTVTQSANTIAQEDPAAWTAQQMEQMAASTPVSAAKVSTNTNLPELYRFDNKYFYGTSGNTWAKIDTSGDGVWSLDELKAYAADYEKATGRTLDAQALFDKYATLGSDGTYAINYSGMNAMYADDALGISYVKDEILRAEMGASTGGPQTTKNFDDFVDKYTYGYPGKMYAKVDQNEDGVWTLDELKEYAAAYEKATGKSLDAEALFAKYDRDGNGALTYTEMKEMYDDDALGLGRIKDMLDAKSADKGADKGSGDKGSGTDKSSDRLYNTLKDMWGSRFSSSELRSLSTAFSEGMKKAAMLDAFMSSNSVISNMGWGGNGIFGYQSNNTYTNWMAGNISMLNMFV